MSLLFKNMIFNEQQLESFSKPPFKYELKQVISTHTEIRNAINLFYDRATAQERYSLNETPKTDIFLQGSYCNDTNISNSSDVDIIVRLDTVWKANTSNLGLDELQSYNASTKKSSYTYSLFKEDILLCLQKQFGSEYIFEEEKCFKLRNHPKFCEADVIPTLTYRLYGRFQNEQSQHFTEGICFDSKSGNQIINYPKEHHIALVSKSKMTNGNFKESVRMFKTLRDLLVEKGKLKNDIAKSYFLENLLFNVSDGQFFGTYMDRFRSIVSELIIKFKDSSIRNFRCANGVDILFSDRVWNIEYCRQFLLGLIFIRDQNEF